MKYQNITSYNFGKVFKQLSNNKKGNSNKFILNSMYFDGNIHPFQDQYKKKRKKKEKEKKKEKNKYCFHFHSSITKRKTENVDEHY